MKTLKKSLIVILIAIIGLINISQEVKAETATKLIVHYHRFDPNYSGWQLWLWPNEPTPGDGANFNFTGDDAFGKYMELDLVGSSLEGSTRIGVIVKTSAWDKDVALDRFIDLTNPNELGEVHVYLVSGDPTIYYTSDGIDISNRASRVDFSDINTVIFDASKDVLSGDVTLLEDDVPVTFTNFSMSNGSGSLDLPQGADLTKTYKLIINFNDPDTDPKEYIVGFSGLYTSDEFNNAYGYDGELGAIYSDTETTFKLWAPVSQAVSVNLYTKGHTSGQTDYDGNSGVDTPYETHDMTYEGQGVWSVTVSGDLHGVYYTYDVTNGLFTNEVVDPYAFSTGVNGQRGMIVDFDRLNPENWVYGNLPDTIQSYNDAIISEIHVRDYTTHSSWNGTDAYRGKFLGLVEPGTTYQGVTTGFDHIVELGVTHVQLLPSFDFGAAVDETRLNDPSYTGRKDTVFNWGYMPQNFNAVEGSYSTDPYNGGVRVFEFKTLVQSFHNEDIRVVMDVVYNHHGQSADSNFDLIVPGYYFRMTSSGNFSNGSGTGNETASEHYMMRKFMVDSVVFWATEYNISGFRFDLMKLHDVDTMNAITNALHDIDPTILVYGEPWTGGGSTLPESESAYKGTLDQMPGVAVFNDDSRDGIKGGTFGAGSDTPGFVQGESDFETMERVRLAVTGATNVPGFNLPGAWAPNPNQTINYVTAHDNNVLLDKLLLSTDSLTQTEAQNMVKQANAIILTSNGIPFLHGGVEIMRTKPCIVIDGENQGECEGGFDHNSYRSPDETNQINWQWKVDNIDVFNYYKGLIELRKSNSNFSMDSIQEMDDKLTFIPTVAGTLQYIIFDPENPWAYIMVVHNNADGIANIDLQGQTWNVVVNKDQAGTEVIEQISGSYTMQKNETLVMYIQNPYLANVPEILEETTQDVFEQVFTVESQIDFDQLEADLLDELDSGSVVEFIHEIDYETEGTYELTIKVTDQFGNITERDYQVTVELVDTPLDESMGWLPIALTITGVLVLGGIGFFFIKPKL